jgi:CHAT domain-containing protein
MAIPPAPGMDNLKVSDEIAAVKLLYSRLDVSVDFLEHRLADEMVRCMIESSVVHFASHNFSDKERASLSALYLENGDYIDKLSVGVLQTLNHQLAQVAYLSACSTARIGARNL